VINRSFRSFSHGFTDSEVFQIECATPWKLPPLDTSPWRCIIFLGAASAREDNRHSVLDDELIAKGLIGRGCEFRASACDKRVNLIKCTQ
jgi:hypothetical protein